MSQTSACEAQGRVNKELWTEKSGELQEQLGECELRCSVMMEPARRTRRRDFRR
jgi:hypothetical protein